jgi:hypothetical protein
MAQGARRLLFRAYANKNVSEADFLGGLPDHLVFGRNPIPYQT